MHVFIILTVTLLLSIHNSDAQKKLPAFGHIDPAELQMKACPFDPDAPAMKIFDVEESDLFLYNYGETRLKIEHRTRIKIFNEKGYKYATIRIPYLSKRGLAKLKELKGVVYNLDASGKVITQRLEKRDFYKEKLIGDIGLVNFTFPGLKPGSVIEFSYINIEKNVLQLDPWQIQDNIPVAYSGYTIIAPTASIISSKLFGNMSIDSVVSLKRSNNIRINAMYKENIPAFVPERYMTSEKDNQAKMIFFHIPERMPMAFVFSNPERVWKLAGDYLLNSDFFGGQIKKKIPGTEALIDSAEKLKTISEKISYLYTSVKKQFPGNKDQRLLPDDLSEAWKEQSANSAEVNLILLNLLGQVKINSYPLLVSTRENGMIDKTFPSLGQLNGVDAIAMIDSTHYYLLDASLENQMFDTPPLNILNREALLLKPGNIDWFLVNDERPLFKQSINIIGEISEVGILEGQANVQHYYYAKSHALDTTAKKEGEERFADNKREGLKIISAEKTFSENEGDPLFETISFKYELPNTNEFLFLTPHFLAEQSKNPFTATKRYTNIDFGSNQEIITNMQINLPASYTADELPKIITLRAPDSSFFYKRTITKEGLRIHITTVFSVAKPLFDKTEYEGVKDFFQRMYALQNEEILLIKRK